MANYDNQPRFGATVARGAESAIDAGLRAHMIRVYNYMASGLVITGVAAFVAYLMAYLRRRRSTRWPTGCI